MAMRLAFSSPTANCAATGGLNRAGEGLGEDIVARVNDVRVNGIGGDHHDTGILADGAAAQVGPGRNRIR